MSRLQELIKLRGKITKVETKRTIQRIRKTKSWFSEKINKIDNPLAKLTKVHRDDNKINKIRNEEGEIEKKKETEEIQEIRTYYKTENWILLLG
jgi:DNA repair exonuclease SbcCD ATPase subunit